jgi:hypothetical protein
MTCGPPGRTLMSTVISAQILMSSLLFSFRSGADQLMDFRESSKISIVSKVLFFILPYSMRSRSTSATFSLSMGLSLFESLGYKLR